MEHRAELAFQDLFNRAASQGDNDVGKDRSGIYRNSGEVRRNNVRAGSAPGDQAAPRAGSAPSDQATHLIQHSKESCGRRSFWGKFLSWTGTLSENTRMAQVNTRSKHTRK